MPPKAEKRKSPEGEGKQRRAANWTREEESVLTDAVLHHFDKLFGAHSMKLDEGKKKALWAVVTSTVS